MISRLLPPNCKEAPTKKLRGLKRYFRRVLAQANAAQLNVGDDSSWDYYHYHPDLYGYGNLGWRMRARHLEALAVVFGQYARQLSSFTEPYQLWIYLDARDSSQDAVYVHSPNPNHDHFPLVLAEAAWDAPELARYFEGLLPGLYLRAGRWGASAYYVYSADFGLPLAP